MLISYAKMLANHSSGCFLLQQTRPFQQSKSQLKISIYRWNQKFIYTLQNLQNVNNFTKIRRIIVYLALLFKIIIV